MGTLKQKNDRFKRIEEGQNKGKNYFTSLTKRELFIAGLALYWAEGSKKQRAVTICNSDPKLIQFIIYWLKSCFNISSDRIRGSIGINEIHRDREDIVKKYWSEKTRIPLTQFTKTSFKKVHNKKVYENFHDYYGTFVIKLVKPGQLYYDIIGFIEALYSSHNNMAG